MLREGEPALFVLQHIDRDTELLSSAWYYSDKWRYL